jgi:hypothetical protein
MKMQKKTLIRMDMPYAVSLLDHANKMHLVACTEDRGAAYTFTPPDYHAVQIAPGPGGCMSLIQLPAAEPQVLAVTECFLGYQFHSAGIDLFEGTIGQTGWRRIRLCDLPFAHRLEIVNKAEGRFLIAATLAATKKTPADWSEPGSVFIAFLPDRFDQTLTLNPVLTGLHKNHGMLVSRLQDVPVLLISAQEGIFMHNLQIPGWEFERIMDYEVSEIQLIDLDGDGQSELVTIEGFHGNVLRVYKSDRGSWRLRWEKVVDYGHGLWTGSIRDKKSLIVGNRSGNRDLELYTVESTSPLRIERRVIEAGVGTANIAVLGNADADFVFSANQATEEIACYSILDL